MTQPRHASPLERTPARFNVHTSSDVRAMLEIMGLDSVEQLFADAPAAVVLGRDLELPPALSEWELVRPIV
ncbi:MAG: glycine dehydrogenase subunit 1 [Pseudonocardiales bacterium]|nr:glycine dehydrogenase subunit 1 [Pseudonocardiales bacterium]